MALRFIVYVFLLQFLFLSYSPPDVKAASYSGKLTTVLEFQDTQFSEDDSILFYQYGSLRVRDITSKGLYFSGYGRLADDLKNNDQDVKSRLYTAYLGQNGLFGHLDFKLGRQFITTTAGASVMDGLYLKYNDLGPLNIKLFGGGDVKYDENYSSDDLVFGGELSGEFFKRLYLGASYIIKLNGSDVAKELVGFEAEYEIENLIKFYNETQYNMINENISYNLLGFKYFRNPKWSLRAEYLYSLPVFETSSIYSVFAVDEYEEIFAELTFNFTNSIRSYVNYTREFYKEFSDADVYEFGIEKTRQDKFKGYAAFTLRKDKDGGDLKGVKLYGSYFLNKYADIGAGIHYDVVERALDEFDDSTSKRYWVTLTSYITNRIYTDIKLERVESAIYNYYNSAKFKLNIIF